MGKYLLEDGWLLEGKRPLCGNQIVGRRDKFKLLKRRKYLMYLLWPERSKIEKGSFILIDSSNMKTVLHKKLRISSSTTAKIEGASPR
ncbi:hypothetical protein KSD_49760 [Ktedonobacter sp. SOSP1-85]|nr:hypothetical protein [Ktedonobacter sp. SOSP1-85]GHO77205.1 hypothetical protein KSD_49760 [Ktedonobacter sp. SOSP1-85]